MPVRGFKIKVENDQKTIAALNGFDKKVRRKALKKAHRRAAKEVVRMIRARVPKRTGSLSKSIGSVIKEVGGIPITVVGVRSDYSRTFRGREIRPILYAFVVEARTPFLSPVRDTAKSVILPAFTEAIRKEIEAAGK